MQTGSHCIAEVHYLGQNLKEASIRGRGEKIF